MDRSRLLLGSLMLAVPLYGGCYGSTRVDAGPLIDAPGVDGGPGTDAGRGSDAGHDAGWDAGSEVDAGDDAGTELDAGADAGTHDAGADAGMDAGPPTAPPVITRIEWTWVEPCVVGTPAELLLSVTATDADTAEELLTYGGYFTRCNFLIDASTQLLQCDNGGIDYAVVDVEDADGNYDRVDWVIEPCTSGVWPP